MFKFLIRIFGLQILGKGMKKMSKDMDKTKEMPIGKVLFYSFTFPKMIGLFNRLLNTNGEDK